MDIQDLTITFASKRTVKEVELNQSSKIFSTVNTQEFSKQYLAVAQVVIKNEF